MRLLHDAIVDPLLMLGRGLVCFLTHNIPILEDCTTRAFPDVDPHCERQKSTKSTLVFLYLVATLHYQNHHLFFSLYAHVILPQGQVICREARKNPSARQSCICFFVFGFCNHINIRINSPNAKCGSRYRIEYGSSSSSSSTTCVASEVAFACTLISFNVAVIGTA